jgi:hypothetical protein
LAQDENIQYSVPFIFSHFITIAHIGVAPLSEKHGKKRYDATTRSDIQHPAAGRGR